MKVNFEYTKEEYKKYLLKGRLVSNIVLFVIGLGIYLYFTLNKISLLYLPLFIVGLLVVIFLLNKLYVLAQLKVNEMLNYSTFGKYTLELTPNKFSVRVNSGKTDYKYKDVKKIVEKKDSFEVKFKKGRDYLTFEKKFFTEEEYAKAIKMFKEKIN